MTQTRVMVVEGERVAALGIRTQLQHAGYLVPAIVSYGEDAFHQAAEIEPDVVLMNVHLKGEMGGVEAGRRIEADLDLPVVYLLDSSDPDALQRVESVAAYGRVTYPAGEQELQATIEMALYKHGVDRELRAQRARAKQNHAALKLAGQLMHNACDGQEPHTLLRTACREMADILTTPYAVAVLLKDQGRTAHLIGEFALDGQWRSLDANLEVSGTPLLQYALARDEPWIIEDIGRDSHVSWLSHRLPKDDVYSALILPLANEGAVLGGLAFTVTRERGFGPEDVALGWTVVRQLAAAIACVQRTEERSRLSAAIEQMAEAVTVVDLSGKIVYANQAVEHMSGYAVTELLGHDPGILRSDGGPRQANREPWATVGEGQVWRGHMTNRKREGTVYMTEAIVSPLRNRAGEVTHYLSVERGIAQALAGGSEDHPSNDQGDVGQLTGRIVHDLNNLLTTINGNASLLLYGVSDEEELNEAARAIMDAGERAADLIRRLPVSTRQPVSGPRSVSLNDIVEDIGETLRRTLDHEVSLQVRLAPDLWPIKADPALVRELVSNLVDNAYEAMPDGGRLTISTSNVVLSEAANAYGLDAGPGEYVTLSVEDSGIGMSQDVQWHLFEPFFTTKGRGEGAGLGLVAVHRIVQQCGGTIELESAEGQGTLFRIYLPCARENRQTQELPALQRRGQRGKETILLVEDDDSIFELTQRVLARSGYTLLTARDGLEAKHIAESHPGPIDLLLTDLTMPRMDGRTLAQGLIRTRPELKVLLMSGYAGADGQRIADMAFVQKPFRPQELVQKVRSVLDQGPVLGDLRSLERTGS